MIDSWENINNGNNLKNDAYRVYREKYLDLINLYNTYDIYLKNKYEIKINYKALDNIKNYF